MVKRINNIGVIVFVVALASSVLEGNQALAADLPSILKEAQAKHAKLKEEVEDMTVVQEMKEIITPKQVKTSEVKVLTKGKKLRIEHTPEMPQGDVGGGPLPKGLMQTIIIYDGNDAWMISPLTGKQKVSDEDAKQYRAENKWWEINSIMAKIVRSEKVDERDCYVIEIKEHEQARFSKIWVDKEKLHLIMAENKRSREEWTISVFSDFRNIGGDREMPYKTEMYIRSHRPKIIILVKSVEINKGLSDDLFDADKVKVKSFDVLMQEHAQEMMKK